MLLNNIGANRTSAIYGDANTQAATIVPDLTKAADGVNLTVTSNSDELNIYQTLNLNDLVYETLSEEIYPTEVAGGHLAIQGNLMGWTDMTKMFLELNPKFTFTDVPADILAADRYIDNSNLTNISLISNQPSFAMLSPLIKFEIQMGNNNQIVGRQMMNQLEHIKLIAQDNKMEDGDIEEMTNMGLPLTRNLPTFLQAKNSTGTSVINSGLLTSFAGDITSTSVTEKYLNLWNSKLSDLLQLAWLNYAANISGTPFTGLDYLKTTSNYIAIPLRFLNTFFKEKAYLPPGLKFRFNIEYVEGVNFPIAQIPINVITTFPGTSAPSITNLYYITLNVRWEKNMRLTYKRSMLRAEAQARINQALQTRPFLYNYTTYEYIAINTDGVRKIFIQDIAVSQQRPTSIFFKVVPIITSGTTSRTLGITSNSYRAFGTNALLTTTDYPYSECCAISFSEIKIYIAGRITLYYRTSSVDSNMLLPYFKDGSQLINNAANKHVDQNNDQTALFNSSFQSSFDGTFIQISLNPGDMQKNGEISTDMGATVIRVEFTLQNNTTDKSGGLTGDYRTVPQGYRINIYKKLQEQASLDGAFNYTTITWPAVKSNSGYLISNTYNVN
jgi:hypothetical protein